MLDSGKVVGINASGIKQKTVRNGVAVCRLMRACLTFLRGDRSIPPFIPVEFAHDNGWEGF